MNTALSFDAVRRTALVRPRLELVSAPTPSEPADFAEVREAIEDALQQLAEDVRAREPAVAAKLGRSHGGVIELFVFCTFTMASRPDVDAIVAGVTILRTPNGFDLTADVCGEESGRIYSKEEPLTFEGAPTRALVDIAAHAAARLSRRADAVLTAVRESQEI